jgi:hypothetical protein
MSTRKLKTAICICGLALAVIWLNARLSKVEQKSSRMNPSAGISFNSASEHQKAGLSPVFDEPSFPELRISSLPSDLLSKLDISLDSETERLGEVVPLDCFSSSACARKRVRSEDNTMFGWLFGP